MRKIFHDRGFEEFLYWQANDKKIFKKINDLIKDIERNGESNGIGKPEALKDNWQGWYSRRIDEKNRLIYRIFEDAIEIAQCKGHYGDK